MPRPSEVVLLCEGRADNAFVRTLLGQCGIPRIRVEMSPSGKGAGSQFVRENLLRQVRACRQRRNRAETWLIAITDADDDSVSKRLSSLGRVLTNAGEPPLQPEEPILLLVPKRCIETWIFRLLGNHVSETDRFTRAQEEKASKGIKQAAQALHARIRDKEETGLPSLDRAASEILRLLEHRRRPR